MADQESQGVDSHPNPLEPAMELEQSAATSLEQVVHPQEFPMTEDSATTKAEKFERHGVADGIEESPSKRRKVDAEAKDELRGPTRSERQKGVAPVKAESECLDRDRMSFANIHKILGASARQ